MEIITKGVCSPIHKRKSVTSRFWKNLLNLYWSNQMSWSDDIGDKLRLSKTAPAPQIHFLSNRSFSLSFQQVERYAKSFEESDLIPFEGAQYLGMSLPDVPIRNNLARFYPDKQFYFAVFNTVDSKFAFKALLVTHKKPLTTINRDSKSPRRDSSKKPQQASRQLFPIALKAMRDQIDFMNNFVGAKVAGTPQAMLLAQTISSIIMSTQSHSSMGRLSIRIPGLSTLPPPKEVDKFYVRSTIQIAKIPSIALEFKFEAGVLTDLLMHSPNTAWLFVN